MQEAVYRIVDMQLPDGSFGMWGPYSPAAEWLQSYAMDFLLRARDQQMAVPSASLQRGLTWLNRTVDKLTPNAQAYAWYVLAKAGLPTPAASATSRTMKPARSATGSPGRSSPPL